MAIIAGVEHTSLGFVSPDRPDMTLLSLLHRENDGYVTLHRKKTAAELAADPDPEPEDWLDLCAVPVKALPTVFPQLMSELDADSFFSINAFWRGARDPAYVSIEHEGRRLRAPCRRGEALRWLNAMYVDLDCYKVGLTPGQAIGALIDMQDRGEIPAASFITKSGQGVWCFWLLHGQNDNLPGQVCVRELKAGPLYRKVLKAVQRRLAKLGSDPQSSEPVRVCRVPGSLNTKAGTGARVEYWIRADSNGQVATYRLCDLARQFGVIKELTKRKAKGHVCPAKRHQGWLGRRARWQRSLDTFERLLGLRGQFREGIRSKAAWVYCVILRGLGGRDLPERTVLECARELFPSMQQPPFAQKPFTKKELLNAVRITGELAHPHVQNQSFSDLLDVTPDEAKVLGHWPPATRYGGACPKRTRSQIRNERRDFLQAAMQNRAEEATLQALVDELRSRDIPASVATVRSDLLAMGLATSRQRGKEDRLSV